MTRLSHVARRTAGFVISLLLLGVTLGAAAYVAPGLLGYERYVITGGSMSGTFEKGSLAFEKQVPIGDLAVGDVITYLPPADSGVGTLVTHRIATMAPGKANTLVLTTKGDANADPDPWKFSLTQPTQPVVTYTVPHLGYAFIALANPQVRILVIGVPAAVIALLALRDLFAALRPQHTASPGGRRKSRVTPGELSPA